ncbi:unnamed protein product [Phyllotreta striolata]|uniref:Uncharacterized protein n=1 Tax=Phyllotreta striolata TaxID=444603 RepID=A0A9N9XJ22_PHYSR|nr:unnamed protein product [Phyllotreta striolata]
MNDQSPVSVGQLLFDSLTKYGDKTLLFIADTGERVTHSELLTWSVRAALRLREDGVRRGDIVSTCTDNHKYSWIPFLATQFLGGISANFNSMLPPEEAVLLMRSIRPKVLFVSKDDREYVERCLKEAGVDAKLVVFGSSFSDYIAQRDDESDFKPATIDSVTETAVVIFSSGTTGLPKGVCLSHNSWYKIAQPISIRYTINDDDAYVFLFCSTLYWITGIFNIVRSIYTGNVCVVCRKFDTVECWKYIEKYKVTVMFIGTFSIMDFVKSKPENIDASSLKLCYTGGSPVTVNMMKSLCEALPHTKILLLYGMTETTGGFMSFDPTDDRQYEMQLAKPLSSGLMPEGVEWKVVDVNTNKILGPNENGELRVKMEILMNGYFGVDSSEVFDSDGYFKTGDICNYDEDKCFFIVDRIKEMIKYRGWQISPAFIVDVLLQHPAVSEAAVIGIPHEIDVDHPMGIVVVDKKTTEKEIADFVNSRVTDVQKLRAGVRIVEKIPKTVSGKVKKSALIELVKDIV